MRRKSGNGRHGRGRDVTWRRGDRRELAKDGGEPSGFADLVGDEGEELLVVLVDLEQLLRVGLGGLARSACSGLGLELGLKVRPFVLGGLLLHSHADGVLRPDGEELADLAGLPAAEADRDAAGVDEEIELHVTEERNPFGPLDASRLAGIVDGARGEAIRGEGEAATPGATERLLGIPRRGELRSEVSLESKLELDDGDRRVASDEGASEVGDGLGEGDREGTEGNVGRHDDRCDAIEGWKDTGAVGCDGSR